MRPRLRTLLISVISAIALGGLISGCSGSSSTSTSTSSSTTTDAVAASTSTSPPAQGDKVSANNASADELTAAFDAAGIAPADRWAREVEEYRPYPTNDPTMAKLRQELAKYNPSSELVDKIVAALSLP